MNKLFKFRNNKLSLIKNTDNGNNNLTYNVIIEKGLIGIVLEIYDDKYYICEVLREELKDKIKLNDQLIKINDKDINDLSFEQVLKLCTRLKNKKKKLEILKMY